MKYMWSLHKYYIVLINGLTKLKYLNNPWLRNQPEDLDRPTKHVGSPLLIANHRLSGKSALISSMFLTEGSGRRIYPDRDETSFRRIKWKRWAGRHRAPQVGPSHSHTTLA